MAGGHLFRQVESNFQHSCGVTFPDNKAYCWGENTDGRLGDGTLTNRSKPAAVAGGLLFRQITAGYRHTCGVATDNRAYCWGLNDSGHSATARRPTAASSHGGWRPARTGSSRWTRGRCPPAP